MIDSVISDSRISGYDQKKIIDKLIDDSEMKYIIMGSSAIANSRLSHCHRRVLRMSPN